MTTASLADAPRVDVAPPRDETPSLRRNVLWLAGGNLVYGACQWGMLALLAKLGTPAMVGQFALALAVTAPVMQFANLHLSSVQATDARGEHPFADYLRLRVVTTAAGLVAIVALTLATYRGETARVVLAVGLAKAVEAISDIYFGLFQRHERMRALGTSLMVKGPLSLVAFVAGLQLTGRVVWAAVAMGVAWALLLAGYDARQGRATLAHAHDGSANASAARPATAAGVWQLARLALPLGVVALAASLTPNVPRYFIEHELGAAALGVFAAMAYVLVAGQNVLTSVTGSVAPRLADAYARGDRRAFTRLLAGALAVAVLGGGAAVLVAVVAGPPLLARLYTPDYARHADVFVRLMVAGVFVYVAYVLWGATTATRYLRVQTPLFAATGAVAVITSATLVPRLGLQGAATAVLVTYAFQSVALAATLVVALRPRGAKGG